MKHIQKLRKLILTLGILAGMSLTAYADSAQPSVTISPENGGSVSFNTTGSGSWVMYYFTATPAEGYHFVKWTFPNFNSGEQDSRSSNPWSLPADNFTKGYYGDVTAVFEQNIVVSNISLGQSAISLSVGGTQTLTSTISPDNATYKTVTWSSDNESVATVSDGVVTAVSAGTANITVTATNGTDDTSDDKQATCTVTVTAEKSVTFTNNGTQDGITVNGNYQSGRYSDCFYINSGNTLTISSGNDNTITKLEITDAGHYAGRFNDSHITVSTGNKSIQGSVLTVTDINAKSVTLSATDHLYWTTNKIVVYYEEGVTVAAKADPSTTGTYYATFYDSTTSYTADCEVYYATANADGRLTLQKAEGNVIKAGEGVILKATSETVTLTQTDSAASYDSLLTGSDTETSVENALVLSLGKNGVWFYKYSGTLGANKAYLAQ